MLCNYCKNEFDQKLNIPRLLILCGHSLCQTCCYRLHLNNRVQCPQCKAATFIQSISMLPKNLALISCQSNYQLCSKHHKKYQAFCENQNILICIECILQDGHKNHQMGSIRNCYDKNKQKWLKKIEKIQKFLQKIQQNLTQNEKLQQQFNNVYSNSKESVIIFFKQIRDIIDKQQQTILNKFKDIYNQVNNKSLEKIQTLNKHFETVNLTINQLDRYQTLSDVQFLQSYHNRENIYNSIHFNLQEITKMPTVSYSKKTISQTISKQIQNIVNQKIDKSDKKISVPFISSYSSIANSMKKNTEVVVSTIKAVKKVTPNSTHSNFHNPSNSTSTSNNKKKYGMKKQITSTIVSGQNNNATVLTNRLNNLHKQKVQINFNTLSKDTKSDISNVDQKQSLCHSFLSNMTSFLSQRKSIYLIGGFNDQANNIVKLNLTTFNWENVASLTTNRSKFGAISIDKQIYLFGGKKGKQRVNDCEIFNVKDNKWTKFNSINKIRSGFAVVHLEDLLYFIGGNDGDNILNSVQTFNIVTGQWKRKQSMHEARDQLAVVVGNNNRIYAIGGFGGNNNSPLKSAQVYDPRTEKWRLLPSMNEARRALSAAVLADGIYAIGGFDGNNYMNSVEKYQQGDKQWIRMASMKQARCTHSSISLFESQQIYVFGGFDFLPLDSVEKYNIISNQWQIVCKMPQARFMHSSLLLKQD